MSRALFMIMCMEILVLLVVILLAVFVYFLPVIIAFWRRHTYRWVIFILNIFGFLGIFWIVALIWSVCPRDEMFN